MSQRTTACVIALLLVAAAPAPSLAVRGIEPSESERPITDQVQAPICGGVIKDDVAIAREWTRSAASLAETLLTPHFSLRYTTQGSDSIDIDYANRLANYLEIAYERFMNASDLSMRPPRGDDDPANPETRIGCDVLKLPAGIAGRARVGFQIPDDCPNSRSGTILIHNHLNGPGLRLASAHELFHICQFREDAWESRWLDESTADWAANRIWPSDIDYFMFKDFFERPHLPLWSDEPRWRVYATAHFWNFLDLTLNDRLAPKVWARCCSTDWFTAVAEEISAHGATFDSMLVEFAKWNHATASSADDRHYPDGESLWGIRPQATHQSYPVSSASLPDSLLACEAGSDYIRFTGKALREQLRITLSGDPRSAERRRVSFVATVRPSTHTEWTLAPDADGAIAFTLDDWPLYDRVTMIVSNFASGDDIDSAGWRFNYSAEEIGPQALDIAWPLSEELLRVGPNPVSWTASIRFRVDDPTRTTRLTIYDVTGRVVRTLANGSLVRGEHAFVWNGEDDHGHRAGSGVYVLEAENESRLTKRLVLLR